MKILLWSVSLLSLLLGLFFGFQILVNPSHFQIADFINNQTNQPDTLPVVVEPLPLGRHFMVGHWTDTPVASTTELLVKYQLAGVVIMSAPSETEKIRSWTEEWQQAVSYPLLIAIDQEGGEVTRLQSESYTTTSQRQITSTSSAYAIGYKRGIELAKLGINMNFAPVLDTATKPDSFLYRRVFPHDPSLLAVSLARGLETAGVTPVAKHFPGHPDSPADSHTVLPQVEIEANQVNNFIQPFVDFIQTFKPKALMTAHVVYPQQDLNPATLSSYWLTTVLREQIGFTGLIITDDMSMDAIDTTKTSTEASRIALLAGADIILFAARPADISETLDSLSNTELKLVASDARIRDFLLNKSRSQ